MFIATKKFLQSASPNNHLEGQNNLSIILCETIFLTIMVVLGIHSPVTIIAQWINLPFRNYLLISPLLILISLYFVFILRLKKLNFNIIKKDYDVIKWLLLLSIICAVLPLITHRITTDDYFYVPNAVYFLDHLNQPMDFGIHFFTNQPDKTIVSLSQGTSLTYEYFRAVIAYYLHVNFLAVYYLSGPVMAFLLPIAHFLLISRFVSNAKHALIGTIASLSITLVLFEGNSFTNAAFLHAYLGKANLLALGIPLFAVFSFSFINQPNIKNWVSLLATSSALVGMSTSAIILLSVLSLIIFGAYIATFKSKSIFFEWKSVFRQGVFYLTIHIYIFLYSIFLFVGVKRGIASFDPFIINTQRGFLESFGYFSNPSFPLTPVLMFLALILLLVFVNDWQRKFLVLWVVILLVSFLNPISAKILVGRLIPSDIYWRLFYLIPLQLITGIIVASLSARYRVTKIISAFVFALALTIFVFMLNYRGILTFSIYKMPLADLASAQQVAKIAPAGTMLAPPNLYGIIPMVDGFHPQIRSREDGNFVYLSSDPKEILERQNASLFVGGDTQYIQEFETLLKKDLLRTVVLRSTIFVPPFKTMVNSILKENGYIYKKEIGEYILVWK